MVRVLFLNNQIRCSFFFNSFFFVIGNADDREYAMNIMYGGQTTPYDFHSVGFDFDLLNKVYSS